MDISRLFELETLPWWPHMTEKKKIHTNVTLYTGAIFGQMKVCTQSNFNHLRPKGNDHQQDQHNTLKLM